MNVIEEPLGRTHLGRLAAPVWYEDSLVRSALAKLDPEDREEFVRRVNARLELLRKR